MSLELVCVGLRPVRPRVCVVLIFAGIITRPFTCIGHRWQLLRRYDEKKNKQELNPAARASNLGASICISIRHGVLDFFFRVRSARGIVIVSSHKPNSWQDTGVTDLIRDAADHTDAYVSAIELLYPEMLRRVEIQLRGSFSKNLNLEPCDILNETYRSQMRTLLRNVSFNNREHCLNAALRRCMTTATRSAKQERKRRKDTSNFYDAAQAKGHADYPNDSVDAVDLWSLVEKLDASVAVPLKCRYYCNMTYAEISDLTDVPESTLRRRVDKGLLLLGEHLK